MGKTSGEKHKEVKGEGKSELSQHHHCYIACKQLSQPMQGPPANGLDSTLLGRKGFYWDAALVSITIAFWSAG